LIRDCLGEVANILAGQAKTLLLGTRYHFTLSTPQVMDGVHEGALPEGTTGLAVAFDSEVGEFAMEVWVPLQEG
jgi:CheY-specific phosphatase CheX